MLTCGPHLSNQYSLADYYPDRLRYKEQHYKCPPGVSDLPDVVEIHPRESNTSPVCKLHHWGPIKRKCHPMHLAPAHHRMLSPLLVRLPDENKQHESILVWWCSSWPMAQGLAIQSIFPWMKEGKKEWTQASVHFRPGIIWNVIFLGALREVGLWARSASKPGAARNPPAGFQQTWGKYGRKCQFSGSLEGVPRWCTGRSLRTNPWRSRLSVRECFSEVPRRYSRLQTSVCKLLQVFGTVSSMSILWPFRQPLWPSRAALRPLHWCTPLPLPPSSSKSSVSS